jgi:hypothetical protein
VCFDRFVRHDEGKIQISLSGNSTIEGRVDRNSNLNGTARIMGGVLLRDWFQNNFRELDELLVEFILPDKIKIKR